MDLSLQQVGVTTSQITRPNVLPLADSLVLDSAGFSTSTTDYGVCPTLDAEGNARPIDNDLSGGPICTAGSMEAALLFANSLE